MVRGARNPARGTENRIVRAVVMKRLWRAIFIVGVPPVEAAQQNHRGDGDGKRSGQAARPAEYTKHWSSS